MIAKHEQYVVNDRGKKTAVILPFKEWEHIQAMLEELDDIRAYDTAKSLPSDPVSWDDALAELKDMRK